MRQFWLAFMRVHGVGAQRVRQLHDYFGDMERAWFASAADLADAGIPATAIEHHHQLRRQLNPDQELRAIERMGAWILIYPDEAYPSLLREIPAPPSVLYGMGELLPSDAFALAVVGTRSASRYGVIVTERLVTALAHEQITIVSGLARGIDVHAHQAALRAGGRTLAVLGSGIDVIYPSEHREIAGHIMRQGAILSMFPPGTKPERHNFPTRNSIISGLCLGTLVVEAPERSGALSTVTAASEQGREVFAVPGNITSKNSVGCHRLIQEGAKLVHDVEDILEEFDLAQRHHQARQAVTRVAPANALEAMLLRYLATDALHVDELSRRCDTSIQDVNATLTLMELKGMVTQVAPMTYQII